MNMVNVANRSSTVDISSRLVSMRCWQRACPRLCQPRSLDVSKILSLCYIDHDDDNDNDSDDNEDISEGESASKGADERGREVQEGGKGSLHTKSSSPLLRQ